MCISIFEKLPETDNDSEPPVLRCRFNLFQIN